SARLRPARWHLGAASGPRPLSLCLRSARSAALVADRGDAVVALRPPALRDGGGARSAVRRRRRGLELRGRSGARGEPPARRLPAFEPPAARDSRKAPGAWARRGEDAGGVPSVAELARRPPPGRRALRTAASRTGGRMHGG